MSAQEQDAAEARKKKEEEEEEAAKKKKEEEEAEAVIQKEKDEIAAAKKKKMIMTIVGIVVFLALGFAAYMFFTSKSRDAIGGTSSPSETQSVQTGTPLSNTSE
jgi:flagellar basal body-associated protein FliL